MSEPRVPLSLRAQIEKVIADLRVDGDVDASYSDRLAAILASLPAADGWQPIGTAPKNGQTVWAWDDERGSNPAMWIADAEIWVITYDDAEIHPTHWMPLPLAPSAALASPQEPQEPHGWQPIATAPKDGRILILIEGQPFMARRTHDGKFWWSFGHSCGGVVDDPGPTHWMPLPLSPSPAAAPEQTKEPHETKTTEI
jgi:hypothetical protein